MPRVYAHIFVVLGSAVLQSQQPSPAQFEQALRVLRTSATSAGELADAKSRAWAMSVVRESAEMNGDRAVELLNEIILNRANPARPLVLELACDRATSSTAERIVGLMRGLGREYAGQRPSTEPPGFVDWRRADDFLIAPFVRQFAHAVARRLEHPELLLDLLYEWVNTSRMVAGMPRRGTEICAAIATLPVPVGLRREYAVRVLETYDFANNPIPKTFLEICDPSVVPRLRVRLQQSLSNSRDFPAAVARVLAELGDLGSLATMNILEATILTDLERRGRAPEDVPQSFSWRIRIQHPPEAVIPWIARTPAAYRPDIMDDTLRRWMISRALALGVDREAVRQAVLQYARGCAAADREAQLELPEVKARCVELGVLRADDLPDVPLPRSFSPTATAPSTRPTVHARPTPPPVWRPNRNNYDRLWAWFRDQNFQGHWTDERTTLVNRKMCELDLLSPEECVRLTSSQPSGP